MQQFKVKKKKVTVERWSQLSLWPMGPGTLPMFTVTAKHMKCVFYPKRKRGFDETVNGGAVVWVNGL